MLIDFCSAMLVRVKMNHKIHLKTIHRDYVKMFCQSSWLHLHRLHEFLLRLTKHLRRQYLIYFIISAAQRYESSLNSWIWWFGTFSLCLPFISGVGHSASELCGTSDVVDVNQVKTFRIIRIKRMEWLNCNFIWYFNGSLIATC